MRPVFRLLVVALAAVSLMSVGLSCAPPVGVEPQLVLSEVMYNPNVGPEFLEIRNGGQQAVDLSGFCVEDAVSGCFGHGAVLQPGAFAVVSDRADGLPGGASPGAVYSGSLSNSGERVVLRSVDGSVVLDCPYSDEHPWPVPADGRGASLERLHDDRPCSDPSAWAASPDTGGSYGRSNGLDDPGVPLVEQVDVDADADPSEPLEFEVRARHATRVALDWSAGLAEFQRSPARDDGLHPDAVAADGIWTATIPAQQEGTLIRFRAEAGSANRATSLPRWNDTVDSRAVVSGARDHHGLPRLDWFIRPEDFAELTTEHLLTDTYFPAAVAVGDEVFTGAEVKVKGESSTSFPKRKYEFELPDGYELNAPELSYPLDEFAIQVYQLNPNPIGEAVAWDVVERYGLSSLEQMFVSVHRGSAGPASSFDGLYLLSEEYDKRWRERHGYQDLPLFKELFEPRTPAATDVVRDELIENLSTLSGDALREYVERSIDVPAVIDFMVLMNVLRNDDWSIVKNTYVARGADGRWKLLPWDLDNAFVPSYTSEFESMIAERLAPLQPSHPRNSARPILNAVFQTSENVELYEERLREVYEDLRSSDFVATAFDDHYSRVSLVLEADLELWDSTRVDLLEQLFQGEYPYTLRDDIPIEVDPEAPWRFPMTPGAIRELFLYDLDVFDSLIRSHELI